MQNDNTERTTSPLHNLFRGLAALPLFLGKILATPFILPINVKIRAELVEPAPSNDNQE